MQTTTRIYGNTMNGTNGSAVPKLAYGEKWVTPEPEDVDDLMLVLHDSLKLPRP